MTRPIDLRDLPTLHRYRTEGVTLDTALALTWGTALISARAVMDSLFVAGSTLTCLSGDNAQPILAQARHLPDSNACHLTYMAPAGSLDAPQVAEALDYLAAQAGAQGAQHLVAEVAEEAPLFETLRRNQFTVFARQRIWQLATLPPPADSACWRPCQPEDLAAVRRLSKALVPPLVQIVEPPPARPEGLVCWQRGKLRAFVQLTYGPRGIWLTPFIHPDLQQAERVLSDLLHRLPNRMGRTVYLQVRTYQSWLERLLEFMRAENISEQVVMVRRLAVQVNARRRLALNLLRNGQAEMTTPLTSFRLPSDN